MQNSIVAEVLRIAMEYEKYLQKSGKPDTLELFTWSFGYGFSDNGKMYDVVSSVIKCARVYCEGVG